MRRRAKTAKAKVEAKLPATRKSSKNDGARVRDLEKRLIEALEQQTATSEILRVISSSPANVQPVFEAIVRAASRLCDSARGNLMLIVGEEVELAARCVDGSVRDTRDLSDPFHRAYPMRIDASGLAGIVVRERRIFVTDDAQHDERFSPARREAAAQAGFHSLVGVPLMRGGQVIGALNVARTETRPYTAGEIQLLQTFANQAVIAIENVRLVKELEAKNRALTEAYSQVTETLEQQTATSEILGVISRSPTDTQPVFDAIAANAARLCSANDAQVLRVEGEVLRLVAAFGAPSMPSVRRLTRGHLVGRAVLDRKTIHVRDLAQALADYPETTAARYGVQSALAVPLLPEGVALGVIRVSRTEIRHFTDKQIALLKTFADQAVIAIENVRLFTELQEKNQALTQAHAQMSETLEQQTATAEILSVISSSPTDLQPVLDTLVKSAVRFCGADDAIILRLDGETLWAAAHNGPIPVDFGLSVPCVRGTVGGRSVLERRAVHVTDLQAEAEEFPEESTFAKRFGARTTLGVPLLREGAAVGTIQLRRTEVDPFTDKQIDLLKTFAAQAVIAIENVRLFKELEARNRDLTVSLDRQTTTADVLRIIAQSPNELQPVLDAIAASAVRLCAASDAVIERLEGDRFYNAAHVGTQMKGLLGLPLPLTRRFPGGRAVLDRKPVIIDDIQLVLESEFPDTIELQKLNTIHSVAEIPMLSEGKPLGSLAILRAEVRPFTEAEVALLQTFADQAVIAIENVRLFKELEARNRDLTRALEQQTATSEILRVISGSPTDIQPVFDTIAKSVARLCDGMFASVHRFDGELLHWMAQHNFTAEGLEAMRSRYPMRAARDTASGRAVIDRTVIHIRDFESDPDVPTKSREIARAFGYRSLLTVPMVRESQSVGAIAVARLAPFSTGQIALLETFADQAVIAIENVRLFNELQARTSDLTRSVDELTALGEVSRALSSTLDLETVLQTIVGRANELTGTAGCTIWEYDAPRAEFRLRASHYADEGDAAGLQAPGRITTIRKGQGVTTQVMERRQPVQIRDIAAEGVYESPIRRPLIEAGHRALLGVPLVIEDEVIGVLAVTRKAPGEFEPEIVRLLSTFATQSALAIQNARLFLEIEDKSRQLEVASQHKSEFLANMSHELRTPLNAVIGFSEVLGERMFGELNEKQEEYLKDIHASGQHLLSLINDILDLSKIEAGRMELELADFHLPQAIENALVIVRERALRRGITLEQSIDPHVGEVQGDERKVKQVLLNLLSNAIKFTPEGGRVEVRAGVADNMAELSVIDTGVGIAPEDQEAVFEEFRQVGVAEKRAEGTGLGLALARKFIELHGGRIWVKSQVGAGSTFTFRIPLRTGA